MRDVAVCDISVQASAQVSSSLLLMAVMGLLFPAALNATHTELHKGTSELVLSRFSSIVMLMAYTAYLYFHLKSHKDLYDDSQGVELVILSVHFLNQSTCTTFSFSHFFFLVVLSCFLLLVVARSKFWSSPFFLGYL